MNQNVTFSQLPGVSRHVVTAIVYCAVRRALFENVGRIRMPGGKYTTKQERKADHIAEGYEKRGVSEKEAESRAWATVNKQDGGGKNPGGSGRKKASSTKKGG
jgi:hypothetical protein